MKRSEVLYQHYFSFLKRFVGDSAEPRNKIFDAIKAVAKEGKNVVFVAPPSYGKTMIPYTLSYLVVKAADYLSHIRTIHVLPLRSIIDDIYKRLMEAKILPFNEDTIGRQMMHIHEAAYFQKLYVLTTIDTFSLSFLKLPPPEIRKIISERSRGYGDIVRASIFASTIVFDEIQLFFEEGEKIRSVFLALIELLNKYGVPTVIMSATMPSSFVSQISRYLGSRIKVFKYGYGESRDGIEFFSDERFESEHLEKKFLTRLKSIKDPSKEAIEIANIIKDGLDDYERILIVLNNVGRAVNIARILKDMGMNPILLHGKLTRKDRELELEKLASGKWVCVATQVIEAGVNLSAQFLLTDLTPMTALVQRIGRVLRYGKDIEGEIIILRNEKLIEKELAYGIYETKIVNNTFEVLKTKCGDKCTNINWHIPESSSNITGYEKLIKLAYKDISFRPDPRIKDSVKRAFKYDPKNVLKLIEYFFEGSLTRDQPLLLGIVTDSSSTEIEFSNITEDSFPVTIKDLIKITKKYSLSTFRGVFLQYTNMFEEKYKIEELRIRDLISIASRGRLIAEKALIGVIIDETIYNDLYRI